VPQGGAAQLPPVEIVRSENLTNLAAVISWSGCSGTYVRGGTLQRAVSPNGPFADLAALESPVASLVVTDLTAVAGVPYYYRVRYVCDDPLAEGLTEVASKPVPFIRARRLERSWDDLTKLRADVSVMYPYDYFGGGSFMGEISPAVNFDNDLSTSSEVKYGVEPNRALNAALGVVLPHESHVIGAIAHPRAGGLYTRSALYALYGGSSSSDTNTWVQLSPMLGYTKVEWKSVASCDETNAYKYVFLWSPDPRGPFAPTYGNMAEIGFFGWSDHDIIDSGILIPPTEFTATTNATSVSLAWNAGWNVENYRVERRMQGEENWTVLATLGPNARTYSDAGVVRKGFYEYRLTAVAAGKDDVSLPVVTLYLHFKTGMILLLR